MFINKITLLETLFITCGLIIVSAIKGPYIFEQHWIVWIFLIGIIFVLSNICSLPMVSLGHAIGSGGLGVIMVIGAWVLMTIYIGIHGYPPPGYPPIPDEKLAIKCKTTEWVISIDYYDRYSSSRSEEWNFIGRSDQADTFMKKTEEIWKDENPDLKIRNIDKLLICVPKRYKLQYAFDKNYSMAPIEQ